MNIMVPGFNNDALFTNTDTFHKMHNKLLGSNEKPANIIQ